jgi:hypothetical protein
MFAVVSYRSTDLAIVNRNNNVVTILLNKGDATFYPPTASSATAPHPESIVAADFDGDGILDLAWEVSLKPRHSHNSAGQRGWNLQARNNSVSLLSGDVETALKKAAGCELPAIVGL